MKVFYTNEARDDLRRIVDWIAQENPGRAYRFADEIESVCESLRQFPQRHVVMGRYGDEDVRRMVFGNYLVFYAVTGGAVSILRVLHGAQDYSDLF